MPQTFGMVDGDVGVKIRRWLVDESGTAIDLSALATKAIKFEDPNKVVKSGAGTVTYPNGGTDGFVQYAIVNGDINLPGGWAFQFVLNNGTANVIRTPLEEFEVARKLT